MKPIQIIKDYLSFSKGEQRGIVILALIILLVNGFRIYMPNDRQLKPMDFSAFRMEIGRFEQALEQAGKISRQRFNGQKSLFVSDPGNTRDSVRNSGKTQYPSFVIELNSADTLDLQRLRGIGPSFARRITGYRMRLGGFTSVDQILEVYGMDSARFMGIRKYLVVDSSVILKMNLNSIDFKKLIAHPYMPYDLAKQIALYRKRHKGIGTVEELKGLKNFDSVAFVRLYPYLEF